MNFSEYFCEDNKFAFIAEVRSGEKPWSAVSSIRKIIADFLAKSGGTGVSLLEGFASIESIRDSTGKPRETAMTVSRSFFLPSPVRIAGSGIAIGEGTFLEAGAIIKAPCYIGNNCEIRQGAYLRGDVIIGNNSVVGHVTEVKNSIFMDHTHAGHFAYVGDSILGSHVNIGAGTKLANLQFRSKEELLEDRIEEIIIRTASGAIMSGMQKLGAVIGDYSEVGCNTVTSPGSVIGSGCWIYPNTTVPKGFYEREKLIRNKGAGAGVELLRKPV
ncbi:MAG: hypothetical protein HZB29_11400 [Nitrospinae bacterium]|nr:hypothetical protein [Nitrospinota bacterium]